MSVLMVFVVPVRLLVLQRFVFMAKSMALRQIQPELDDCQRTSNKKLGSKRLFESRNRHHRTDEGFE